ncbi:MAG TPA: alpha/beta hydrolase [Mucilaginibacter sp.]|nr:alpha/beta hydrolase [Mucilaginibacter sp.]
MKLLRIILSVILFLIIITGLYAVIMYKKSDFEKKELTDAERKGTSGEYIKLSQGVTHYQIAGPDTGKTVILVHGFSVPYYIWDGTFAYLAAQGFRVLRYDQYGRGFSDRPDVNYTRELYQTQITDLISQLKLKTPVTLIGVSFGGGITTDFTCKHPELVGKVVLIDPVYPWKKPSAPEFYTDYEEATGGQERADGQLADFKYPERHPQWVSKYLVQMHYKGFRHALVSTRYHYNYNGRRDNTCLNAAGKKVLLIWGKDDHTVPFTYSDSVRSVLKAEFFPVDDAAHLPYIEQADTVNKRISNFLKE